MKEIVADIRNSANISSAFAKSHCLSETECQILVLFKAFVIEKYIKIIFTCLIACWCLSESKEFYLDTWIWEWIWVIKFPR